MASARQVSAALVAVPVVDRAAASAADPVVAREASTLAAVLDSVHRLDLKTALKDCVDRNAAPAVTVGIRPGASVVAQARGAKGIAADAAVLEVVTAIVVDAVASVVVMGIAVDVAASVVVMGIAVDVAASVVVVADRAEDQAVDRATAAWIWIRWCPWTIHECHCEVDCWPSPVCGPVICCTCRRSRKNHSTGTALVRRSVSQRS